MDQRKGQKGRQRKNHRKKSAYPGAATEIAYQNKDIISKIIGDHMVGRSLGLLGFPNDIPVKEILPTNLPALKLNELRIDNLFRMEDGTFALVDYESTTDFQHFFKYMDYVIRLAQKYPDISKDKIFVYVLYTADVERAPREMDLGCLNFILCPAYLVKHDTEAIYQDLERQIRESGTVTEEGSMLFILLPLTCRGKEAQNQMIERCAALAEGLENEAEQRFVLAGMLAFTDKVITEEMRKKIGRRIQMTKVGNMLMEEGRREGLRQGRQEGRLEGLRQGRHEGLQLAASRMLERGMSKQEVQEIIGISGNGF